MCVVKARLTLIISLAIATFPAYAQTGFSSGITLDANPASAGSPGQPDTAQVRPWWDIDAADSQLKLLSVEQRRAAAAGPGLLALVFTHPFADSGYGDQLAVYSARGQRQIKGRWQRAEDPRTLLFELPAAGRYILRIRAGLRDTHGHSFNRSISGPVAIARED